METYCTPTNVLILGVVQRAVIFAWGLYQDATMVPKFTDIDYMVFTDAARYVANGQSPYMRDTYRYTPLLAWLLVPTSWPYFFSFGKLLFCLCDVVAGYLMIKMLSQRYSVQSSCIYASMWILNPMVSVISARGSSEGLLGACIIFMVWCVTTRKYFWAGLQAGLCVHLKIYPFIYIPAIVWAIGPLSPKKFINQPRVLFCISTALSFLASTGAMAWLYGDEYIKHSWLHHATRLDHRHNFSVYSTVLYYSLASPSSFKFEGWAFLPQIVLSAVILPVCFARYDLLKTMFLQTWVFVAFNKVCTAQYFNWYMALLPFYMPSLIRAPRIKWAVLAAWVVTQAAWLNQAYQLEFLGKPTFFPGLFASTVLFFIANVWCICSFIRWM